MIFNVYVCVCVCVCECNAYIINSIGTSRYWFWSPGTNTQANTSIKYMLYIIYIKQNNYHNKKKPRKNNRYSFYAHRITVTEDILIILPCYHQQQTVTFFFVTIRIGITLISNSFFFFQNEAINLAHQPIHTYIIPTV